MFQLTAIDRNDGENKVGKGEGRETEDEKEEEKRERRTERRVRGRSKCYLNLFLKNGFEK